MVVTGMLSGFLTLLLPLEISNFAPTNLETIRFFFAHLAIFMTPFFMYLFGIHKPQGKWIKHTLLLFLASGFIIYINSLIFSFL